MNRLLQVLVIIISILSLILLGIVTHSFWITLLTLIGLLALSSGYDMNKVIVKRKRFFVEALVGLILIGGATWLDQLQGRWIWTAIWMLAAFPLFVAGGSMHRKAPRWSITAAWTASALCAIFAVVAPYIHYGLLTSPSFLLWLLVWLLLFLGYFLIIAVKVKGVRDKIVLATAFSLLLAVVTILGIATRSIWISLLTFVGMLLLFKDLNRILGESILKYQRFFISSMAGLILIGGATWLDQLQGGWIWTPIWILAAIPLVLGGSILYDNKNKYELYTKGMALSSRAALVVSALCILFALSGPSILSGMPAAKAFFIWLLLFPGYIFVILAWSEGGGGRSGRFIIFAFLGTALFAAATVYSGYTGRWMWTFLWLLGAVLMAVGALGVPNKAVKVLGMLMSFLYAIFAVAIMIFPTPTLGIIGITVLALLVLFLLVLGISSMLWMNRRRKAKSVIRDEDLDKIFKFVLAGEDEEEKKKRKQR